MSRTSWLVAGCVLVIFGNLMADAWLQVPIDSRSVLQAPTFQALLGTDHLGRSLLWLVPRSTLATLADCVIVFAIAALIGFCAACTSVYWLDRWQDRLLVAFADGVRSFPAILAAMVFASLHIPVMLVLAGIVWVPIWRATRAALAEQFARPFVLRARACGLGFSRVMWHEALPQTWPVILPSALGAMAECLAGLAVLEFLGFGRDLGAPGLGTLASQVVSLGSAIWWVWLPSTLMIGVIVAMFAVGAVSRTAKEFA